MESSLFTKADQAIAQAENSNPETVAKSLNILISEMQGSLIGYATRYASLYVIGVNSRLDPVWRAFALWHELGHVLLGHVKEPAFAEKTYDLQLFGQEVDSRFLSRQEREANLISAEYCIDTEETLELLGYHNRTMQEYRKLRGEQDELTAAYESLLMEVKAQKTPAMLQYRLQEYQRALENLEEKKQAIGSELAAQNSVYAIKEIAGKLHTSETILRYKLEALRLRGYAIDDLELTSYDKVFQGVL